MAKRGWTTKKLGKEIGKERRVSQWATDGLIKAKLVPARYEGKLIPAAYKIPDEEAQRIILLYGRAAGKTHSHWTISQLAKETGMGSKAIRERIESAGIKTEPGLFDETLVPDEEAKKIISHYGKAEESDDNDWTTGKLAETIGFHYRTVSEWARTGAIKSRKKGKNYVISHDEAQHIIGLYGTVTQKPPEYVPREDVAALAGVTIDEIKTPFDNNFDKIKSQKTSGGKVLIHQDDVKRFVSWAAGRRMILANTVSPPQTAKDAKRGQSYLNSLLIRMKVPTYRIGGMNRIPTPVAEGLKEFLAEGEGKKPKGQVKAKVAELLAQYGKTPLARQLEQAGRYITFEPIENGAVEPAQKLGKHDLPVNLMHPDMLQYAESLPERERRIFSLGTRTFAGRLSNGRALIIGKLLPKAMQVSYDSPSNATILFSHLAHATEDQITGVLSHLANTENEKIRTQLVKELEKNLPAKNSVQTAVGNAYGRYEKGK